MPDCGLEQCPDTCFVKITQDQGYIEEIVRYIHLNPVRSGSCRSIKKPDHYAWCGHAAILGTMKNDFQNRDDVLHRFAVNDGKSKLMYRSFFVDGLKTGESADLLETIRKSNDGKTFAIPEAGLSAILRHRSVCGKVRS